MTREARARRLGFFRQSVTTGTSSETLQSEFISVGLAGGEGPVGLPYSKFKGEVSFKRQKLKFHQS